MTLVLIAAMAVSFGTMDWVSGGVIAALVVLNVGVGTVNEYKAEKVCIRDSSSLTDREQELMMHLGM